MARALSRYFRADPDVVAYAAGVSNSGCRDVREFEREEERLRGSIAEQRAARTFIYLGTCSVLDSELQATPYVQHKLAMERIVRERPGHLVLRLPQVAGDTPNPHTLLNFVYARVTRGERFAIWLGARRNIIDGDDVARIADAIVRAPEGGNEIVNVANPYSHSMAEIVAAMEEVTGHRAICDAIDRGSSYPIDVSRMASFAEAAGVDFGGDYLSRVLRKYYGHAWLRNDFLVPA